MLQAMAKFGIYKYLHINWSSLTGEASRWGWPQFISGPLVRGSGLGFIKSGQWAGHQDYIQGHCKG